MRFRHLAERAGMPAEKASRLAIVKHMGLSVAYRPQTSDEGVLAHSFENDIFLTGVPEYRPAAADTVLDVGAHLGDFSLLMSRRVARVLAVEANRETFALLRTNVLLNEAHNIITDNAAIADNTGYTELFHAADGESWGDSTAHDHSQSSEVVPCLTLARYLFERNIPRVNFMKMNCEGAEFPIILSADMATLARFDAMVVLYHCDLVAGTSEDMLCQKLEASGFTTSVRNREPQRGWIVATRS